MAGKLSAMFELEMPNARQVGERAGREFSQGFDYSLNRSGGLATQNSALSLLIRQLAGGGNIIRPPGEAPGLRGIQKLLNMGPLPVSSGINWRQVMLGAAVSPFSPWIGARGIAGGMGGGPGGGGGGVGGALFGGNFSRFEAVFLAIHAAGMVFRKTLEELTQAMHRGFELFSRSAALRLSTGRLFQAQEIGKQMGLSPEQMENLMFRGQWGRARHSLQQFRGMEQMTGMPEVFRSAFNWSEKIAGEWEKISAELFTTNVMLIRSHTQIQTFFGAMGAQISPEFRDMLKAFSDFDWAGVGTLIGMLLKPMGLLFESIKGWILLMDAIMKTPVVKAALGFMKWEGNMMNKGFAALFGEDAPFKKTDSTSVFSRQLPTMSHFEKMGFVFGGMSTSEYLKQTADHTASMAADLRLLVQRQMGGDAHGNNFAGASGGFINVP